MATEKVTRTVCSSHPDEVVAVLVRVTQECPMCAAQAVAQGILKEYGKEVARGVREVFERLED